MARPQIWADVVVSHDDSLFLLDLHDQLLDVVGNLGRLLFNAFVMPFCN